MNSNSNYAASASRVADNIATTRGNTNTRLTEDDATNLPNDQTNGSRVGFRAPGTGSSRFSPNGEERLYIHQLLHDSNYWNLPKTQPERKFGEMIKHAQSDVQAPLRLATRTGLNIKYIKTVVKNMPRFVTERRKKIEQKRENLRGEGESEIDDEALEVSLTKGELTDLKILKLSEIMVAKEAELINSSNDNITKVKASASNSRKQRQDRRCNSQRAYAKRKKQVQRAEAKKENSLRLAEYRIEKLLTATVNDGRQTSQLLARLVHIIGHKAGMNVEQVRNILGDAAQPAAPIEQPPMPELIVIADSSGESESHTAEDAASQSENDVEPEVGEN